MANFIDSLVRHATENGHSAVKLAQNLSTLSFGQVLSKVFSGFDSKTSFSIKDFLNFKNQSLMDNAFEKGSQALKIDVLKAMVNYINDPNETQYNGFPLDRYTIQWHCRWNDNINKARKIDAMGRHIENSLKLSSRSTQFSDIPKNYFSSFPDLASKLLNMETPLNENLNENEKQVLSFPVSRLQFITWLVSVAADDPNNHKKKGHQAGIADFHDLIKVINKIREKAQIS